jgi:hypothetical protein
MSVGVALGGDALRPLLVGFALLLAGCAGPPPARFPEARSALEQLRRTTECSRALTGEADVTFRGDGRRLRGRALYLAAAPDRLRVDVLSPFGATLSTLTSDGERFALYDLENRAFVYGAASACNVARFARVPVPPHVLVELLRGRPPVLAHQPAQARLDFVRRPFERGHYLVRLDGAHEASEELELGIVEQDWQKPLEQQRLRLLGVRVSQAGEPLYEVSLSGHRVAGSAASEPLDPELAALGEAPSPSGPACSAELPGRLRFRVPASGYELVFDNRELTHNPPLGPGAFTQPVPSGVRARESRCQD